MLVKRAKKHRDSGGTAQSSAGDIHLAERCVTVALNTALSSFLDYIIDVFTCRIFQSILAKGGGEEVSAGSLEEARGGIDAVSKILHY